MPDLSSRVPGRELLDEGRLPDEEVRKSLLDLRRINRRFGARAVLLSALAREVSRCRVTRFSVLDIASGSGDLPMAVIEWARSRGLEPTVFALERHHRHLRLFQDELSACPQLFAFSADALAAPVRDDQFDFVMCCHFFHHLSEDEAARLLSNMARWARCAVIVCDLERHPVAYHFFRMFGGFMTSSYVSRVDGLISLGQSFRKPELERIAKRAGLGAYRVERRWPFQLLLVAETTGASSTPLRQEHTRIT